MKKFGKFLVTIAAIGGAVAGAYALYKKYVASTPQEEDLEDDFDELLDEEIEDEAVSKREYVSLDTGCVDAAPETETQAVEISAEALAEKQVAMAEDLTEEAKANE